MLVRVDGQLAFHIGAGNHLVSAGVEHLLHSTHNKQDERGGRGGITAGFGELTFTPSLVFVSFFHLQEASLCYGMPRLAVFFFSGY